MAYASGMEKNRYLWWIVFAAAIPAVGYGVMHLLVYVLPMAETSTGSHVVYTIILIGLGLAVPYWMLKAGIHAAHKHNPQERELHLSDVPKDKDQLNNTRP